MIAVLWLLAGFAGGAAHFALLHRNTLLYVMQWRFAALRSACKCSVWPPSDCCLDLPRGTGHCLCCLLLSA